MYHWGKHRQVNKEARTGNEISSSLSLFHLINTQIHCQPREKSWHTWGALLMNQTKKIWIHANIKRICCQPPSSFHSTQHNKTTSHHLPHHYKAAKRHIIWKKKSCLLSLTATHFTAQYNAEHSRSWYSCIHLQCRLNVDFQSRAQSDS